MKMAAVTGAVLSLFLLFANAGAKEINYHSDISVWVKGGLKAGILDPKSVMVTAVPGINLQRFYTVVEFCGDVCDETHRFLSLSCGMGNEYHISAEGVAVTHQGVSCNWPIYDVVVPQANKYLARVRLDIPSDPINSGLVPSAATTPVTIEVKDLKDENCRAFDPTPNPMGAQERLIINSYVSDNKTGDGILANRDICVSVTPQGASVDRLAFHGGVYGKVSGKEILLGSFGCERNELLQEGAEYRVTLASCNHAPAGPGLATYEGKLTIRIFAHLSLKDSKGVWEEIPIATYPTKF